MKKICFLVLLILVTLGLQAEESLINNHGFNLSLGPSFGLLKGQGEEIVYRDEGSDDKLIQLLWNLAPLVYAGIDLNFTWQKPQNKRGLFSNASFKFGCPMETGNIEDRDWTHSHYRDWLTHYSVHDNKTNSAVLINTDFGVSFKIADKFLLKPFLAYDFMSFAWTASGGSFLYYYGYDYQALPIDVGTYKQTWHIISPGISFSGAFNRYFNAEISLKVSPFVWCSTEDNHIMRNLVITENMQWGFFIEPKFVLAFTPKDFFALSLSVSYRNISHVRGNGYYDYSNGITGDFTYKDGRGAGYNAWDIGLFAKFRILNK
jgi:outer membrane protease